MAQAYDDVPYPDFVFADQHPFHLTGLAQLWGAPPRSLTGARVLEIGSAGAANLLFMAETAPHLSFVGVELSEPQARKAEERIKESGLSNVRVIQGSFTEVLGEEGPFDFILCHGLYSWIAPAVRESLHQLIGRILAPQGLLYVSYNALPGWLFKGYVRELLQNLVPPALSPAERLRKVQELLPTLRSVVSPYNPARSWILPLLQKLETSDPSYLLHEYLSEWNESFWFGDVVKKFSKTGLSYLCETDPAANATYDYSGESAAQLRSLAPEAGKREELLDFLRCPAFRRSIFVRSEMSPPASMDYTHCKGLSLCLAPGITVNELEHGTFELGKPNSVSLSLSGTPAACVKALQNSHPTYQTPAAIAASLGVKEDEILPIVCELVRAGFVSAWAGPLPVAGPRSSSLKLAYVTKMLLKNSAATITARGERVTLTPERRNLLNLGNLGAVDARMRKTLLDEGFFLEAEKPSP